MEHIFILLVQLNILDPLKGVYVDANSATGTCSILYSLAKEWISLQQITNLTYHKHLKHNGSRYSDVDIWKPAYK